MYYIVFLLLTKINDANAVLRRCESRSAKAKAKVFFTDIVPSSMPFRLLRKTMRTKLPGIAEHCVFRGLPAGKFYKLGQLVSDISGDNSGDVAMQIDDEAFKAFDIKHVPAKSLSKAANIISEQEKMGPFDQISGNITIRYAPVEVFANEGDTKMFGKIYNRKTL